jgi:hypothetical protein
VVVAPLALGEDMRFTFTRAELDEAADSWRWVMWCREWGVIGSFVVGIDQLERTLWEYQWRPQ